MEILFPRNPHVHIIVLLLLAITAYLISLIFRLGIGFIFQKCLEKPFWSEILASHCSILVCHRHFGRQVKTEIFNLLQNLYEGKVKIIQEH